MVNGNPDAFNELYLRYKDRLLYYFYRMLGYDEEIAQDFLQELFMKLIDKPRLFDPSKKFSTWIYSIANNMCKNEYRRQDIRRIVIKEDNPDRYPECIDNKASSDALVAEIFNHLDSLGETHKSVFLLKYREGFSNDEIVEILNLPLGTIKSRLFYTRKKIQEHFKAKYPDYTTMQ